MDDDHEHVELENVLLPGSIHDKVREHIANGGTAMCGMVVPVGSQVLILYKGAVTAQEIGIGEILPKDAGELLDEFMRAIGG